MLLIFYLTFNVLINYYPSLLNIDIIVNFPLNGIIICKIEFKIRAGIIINVLLHI